MLWPTDRRHGKIFDHLLKGKVIRAPPKRRGDQRRTGIAEKSDCILWHGRPARGRGTPRRLIFGFVGKMEESPSTATTGGPPVPRFFLPRLASTDRIPACTSIAVLSRK